MKKLMAADTNAYVGQVRELKKLKAEAGQERFNAADGHVKLRRLADALTLLCYTRSRQRLTMGGQRALEAGANGVQRLHPVCLPRWIYVAPNAYQHVTKQATLDAIADDVVARYLAVLTEVQSLAA